MKFNYDIYRPRKLIQDIWRDNNNYFYSKDVGVTPLTKIGDAAKVHQEQTAGKLPALARKLKPSQLSTKTLRFWRPTINRRHTTKIKVRIAGEPSLASADKGKAAFISALRGYIRRVPDILQIRKTTLPLAISALLVLTAGTVGGFRLISESHGAPQANTRKINNSNQDDQQAAANSSTEKRSTEEPDKNEHIPPTPAPSQQNQGTGSLDTTGTNNRSHKNNYIPNLKDSSPASVTPDSPTTPQAPATPTDTKSTAPPAPVVSQPTSDTNTPLSEDSPTSTTPVTDPVTTDPETSDPSVAPTTGTHRSTQIIINQDSSSTSP